MKLIAEMCQNHNGDIQILKDMVAAAAEGGATHAKIQNIYADDLSFRSEFESGEVSASGEIRTIHRPYKAEYDRLKKLELTIEEQNIFISECKKFNLIPLTTPFNLMRIPEIKNFGWKAVKVASYDCGSLPLIKELEKSFDEIIISTGATYDDEIEATANYLNQKDQPFSLLHCVTIYPTPLSEMNLRRMEFLKKFTSSVGLSNHSLTERDGVKADIAGIFLGGEVFERHFTILPQDQTRDGKVSITSSDLREIVSFYNLSESDRKNYIKENVPEFELMLGQEKRALSSEELLNRSYYRGRFCNKLEGKEVFNWDDNVNWGEFIR